MALGGVAAAAFALLLFGWRRHLLRRRRRDTRRKRRIAYDRAWRLVFGRRRHLRLAFADEATIGPKSIGTPPRRHTPVKGGGRHSERQSPEPPHGA